MKTLKPFILVVLFLLVTGCASFGPTIVIETPEPAEDFVVLCQWYDDSLFFGAHGGKAQVGDKVFVTKSGEEVECGLNLRGGDGSVSIIHPVYVGASVSTKTKGNESDAIEVIDGVIHIKLTKTKLNLLDEQKAKFEAGYWDKLPVSGWDKDKTPAQRYARSVGGCGFGHQYLDYYSQVKKVDKQYFYKKYNTVFLRCNKSAYEEVLKYDPVVAARSYDVDKTMDAIWGSSEWRKYEK